jgi:hypothetical protein
MMTHVMGMGRRGTPQSCTAYVVANNFKGILARLLLGANVEYHVSKIDIQRVTKGSKRTSYTFMYFHHPVTGARPSFDIVHAM